jgi:hypothetical protein
MAGDIDTVEANLKIIREQRSSIEGKLNMSQSRLKKMTQSTIESQEKI